jgi:hypothetical protein
MTEAEWLACEDSSRMLHHLLAVSRPVVTERKHRLLSSAYARRQGLGRVKLRQALDKLAEGGSGGALTDRARRLHEELFRDLGCGVRFGGQPAAQLRSYDRLCTMRAAAAPLFRDLFGYPSRPAPSLAPSVLAYGGGTVPRLAAAIYEERAFDRLPVLADALEDAGCTDADILGHCRAGGEHVRGCWVVDLALRKW